MCIFSTINTSAIYSFYAHTLSYHTHCTTSYIVPHLCNCSLVPCCFLTLVSQTLKIHTIMLAYTFTHIHTHTHVHTQTPLLPWHSCPKCCGHAGVSLARHMEGKSECVLTNQSPIPLRERERERWGELKDEDRPTWGLHDLYSRC